MNPQRGKSSKPKAPEGFRPDGSWGPGFDATLTDLVRRLCHLRRTTSSAPAYYAAEIRRAGYERAMRNIDLWEAEDKSDAIAWACLTTTGSLEETIRCGGIGPDRHFLPNGVVCHQAKVIHRPLAPAEERAAASAARRDVTDLLHSIDFSRKEPAEIPPPPQITEG